jgi:hypothetical protein
MTGTNGDPHGDPIPPAPAPTEWRGTSLLESYVEANRDRYTPEALEAAGVAAGHDAEAVRTAIQRVGARRAAAPVNDRARGIVYAAYGLTYFGLAAALLGAPNMYGAGPIAAGILTVVLGVAFAISRYWMVRRSAPLGLGALLSLPLVLLVIVGGACYATTLRQSV